MTFQCATIILLCYFSAVLGSKFVAPRIFQENDAVLNTGDNLTLSCDGVEPLTWTIVNYKKIHYEIASIIKSVKYSEDSAFPYVSVLRIENVSYLNTGFFYCHGIKASKDDPYRSSNIYVYVRDKNRLCIVPPEELAIFVAPPKTEITIPCLPTSPDDIQVVLLSPNGWVEEVSSSRSNFDPRKGFKVRMFSWPQEVVCVFTRNNITETIPVLLDASGLPEIKTSHVYDPSGTNIVPVGGQLILHCFVIVPHNSFYSFKWRRHFYDTHENDRISINMGPSITIAKGKLLSSTFIMNNITMENKGNYECNTFVYSDESRYAYINITVTDTLTKIGPPKINYSGSEILIHTEDNLTLVCEGSESIGWFSDDLKDYTENVNITSYQETKYLYKTVLTISNATIYNAGSFVCRPEEVQNDNPHRTDKIFVFVQDPYYLSKYVGDYDAKKLVIFNTVSNIPCRPSSPDVNVSLFDPNGNKVTTEISSYSPKLGFNFVGRNLGLRTYKCLYQRGNITQEYNIPILVLYDQEYDNISLIEAPEKASVHEGQDLQLNCSMIIYDAVTYNRSGLFLNWTVPELVTTVADKLVIEDEKSYPLASGRVLIRRLTVKRVDFRAEGDYECILYDSLLNRVNYISKYITVLGLFDADLIIEVPKRKYIVTGEKLILNCLAKVNYNVKFTLHWTFNDKLIQNTSHISQTQLKIGDDISGVTGSSLLLIRNLTLADGGIYKCIIRNHLNASKYTEQKITIYEPQPPNISDTNLNNTEWKLKEGKGIGLHCSSSGVPVPTTTWMKNDRPWIIDNNQNRITLQDNNTTVKFLFTRKEDEGKYTCHVSNIAGEMRTTILLTLLTDPSSWTITQIALIVILLLLLLVLLAILIRKVKEEQKRKREFKVAGLHHFEKGAVENINPNLGVDSLAELLPYDKSFEIPREKIKLGKQLGSGFFGVVLQADVFGLFPEEFKKTVAVKMVKGTADYMHIKALLSELKIMIHLGKHLNVVNLIGACTRNISKCELLVVVEYCRYGNIQNYLLKQRNIFINQIDRSTDCINISIGADVLKYFGKHSVDLLPRSNYYNFIEEDARYANVSTYQKEALEQHSLSTHSDNEIRPTCTHDLLCWSYQIAQGMEYLASRKVLHGDLAARNILLADDNIVKICDFGLAKNMYKNNEYKKTSDSPLPVKWMAPESITDRVFSTQSDVWSFGIVLWELFSLARTPYPEKEANQTFYDELLSGYRMSQPEYSTNAIYQIMLSCWQSIPSDRPSFKNLSNKIGTMLTEHVRKYYFKLNLPYANLNYKRFKNEKDFLGLMRHPEYNNLTSTPITYLDIMDSAGSNINLNFTKTVNENKGIVLYSALDLESNVSEENNCLADFSENDDTITSNK